MEGIGHGAENPYAPPSSYVEDRPDERSQCEPAVFWRRLLAWMLDKLLQAVSTVLLVFFTAMLIVLLESTFGIPDPIHAIHPEWGPALLVLVAWYLTGWVILAWPEGSRLQSSLGKHVLGIRVAGVDGARIGLGRSTMRYLARCVFNLPLGLGSLMMLGDRKKRALYDRLLGIHVILRV